MSDTDTDNYSDSDADTNSDADSELAGYRIELYVYRSISYVHLSAEELSDFEALEELAVEHIHPDNRENKLRIVWKDQEERETSIKNDEDLRESIAAQTSDGSNVLRFRIFIENKRRFPSLQSSQEGEEKKEIQGADNELLAIVRRWCAEAIRRNRSPLYLACDGGELEDVQAILNCTYDMVQNEGEEVKMFMRKTIDQRVNKVEAYEEDYTPLHIALHRGRVDIMSLLISEGADMNVLAEDERLTPLNMAAQLGVENYVTLLVAQNANLEIKNRDEMTPLHMAIEQQEADFVSFMIQQKADLEARDGNGWTPLHLAINHGFTETASVLIAFKADIEATDEDKDTPLHIAARFRRKDIVRLLIEHKANLEARNESGKTPFDVTNDQAIKALLQEPKNDEKRKKDGEKTKALSRVQTRSQTKRKG